MRQFAAKQERFQRKFEAVYQQTGLLVHLAMSSTPTGRPRRKPVGHVLSRHRETRRPEVFNWRIGDTGTAVIRCRRLVGRRLIREICY